MHPVPGKVVDTQLTFAVFVLMASSDVLHGPYLLVFTNAVGAAPIRKTRKKIMIFHGRRFHVYVCLVNRQSLVLHVADVQTFSHDEAQDSTPNPVLNFFFVHFLGRKLVLLTPFDMSFFSRDLDSWLWKTHPAGQS